MRVIMRTSSAGPTGVQLSGREYDLPEKEAQELIKAGAAVPARDAGVETATKKPGENAGNRTSSQRNGQKGNGKDASDEE